MTNVLFNQPDQMVNEQIPHCRLLQLHSRRIRAAIVQVAQLSHSEQRDLVQTELLVVKQRVGLLQ